MAKYVYYGSSKGRDRDCKNLYIREDELIEQLFKIIDQVDINELGMRQKFDEGIKRYNKFQSVVLGGSGNHDSKEEEVNISKYVKYLLKEGTVNEKRDLLRKLRSKLVYKNKFVYPWRIDCRTHAYSLFEEINYFLHNSFTFKVFIDPIRIFYSAEFPTSRLKYRLSFFIILNINTIGFIKLVFKVRRTIAFDSYSLSSI